MSHHLGRSSSERRRMATLLAFLALPLLAACQDELTKKVDSNASDYDQGVKADKQYDEQQDQMKNSTVNCQPQSSLDFGPARQAVGAKMMQTSPFLLPGVFDDTGGAADMMPGQPLLVPVDLQLAWGSGGNGGNGGKGHDKNPNCP